jgi:hypothetical protein
MLEAAHRRAHFTVLMTLSTVTMMGFATSALKDNDASLRRGREEGARADKETNQPALARPARHPVSRKSVTGLYVRTPRRVNVH